MPALDVPSSRKTNLSALCVIIVCLCAVALAGCKQDQEQTETGGVHASPVSVMEGPMEIAARDSMPPLPSPDMKGLRVANVPQSIPVPDMLPDMAPVPGMDMSVRLSPRMKSTTGWTQNFATLFPAMMNCLMKIDGSAAYVTQVTDHDNHVLGIEISALDEKRFYCRIDESGVLSVSATQSGDDLAPSILFFPRRAGRPVLDHPHCYEQEPVVARPNGLIGWLAFPVAACAASAR